MRWHWQTQISNSRNDGPPYAGISQFRLTIAWLLDSARRHFESLLRPSDLPNSTIITLKTGSHRGFTVLGLPDTRSERSDAAVAPCAFPESRSSPTNRLRAAIPGSER